MRHPLVDQFSELIHELNNILTPICLIIENEYDMFIDSASDPPPLVVRSYDCSRRLIKNSKKLSELRNKFSKLLDKDIDHNTDEQIHKN